MKKRDKLWRNLYKHMNQPDKEKPVVSYDESERDKMSENSEKLKLPVNPKDIEATKKDDEDRK